MGAEPFYMYTESTTERPCYRAAQRQMTQIPAGRTLTRMTYVVLRAFTARAWASLSLRAGQMKPTVLQTSPIHIRETAAAGPTVRIQTNALISARVTPIPAAGPILYSEYAWCPGNTSAQPFNASATFSRWSRASGTLLHPFTRRCPALAEWVLFVAQVGRPIAQAYYCAQHDRCAYAPPTPQQQAIAACKIDVGKAVLSGRLPRSAARYAIGLSSILPTGLTPTQQALAQRFHARCAPLLAPHGRAP